MIGTQRGSHKSYRTADFLAQRPKNLSIATFGVSRPLSLAYRHGDEALGAIPAQLKETVEELVARQPYADSLEGVFCDFRQISESSIDFNVIAKFDGRAASEYNEIGWLLSQAALEASRRHGWEIPYPQIVVREPVKT